MVQVSEAIELTEEDLAMIKSEGLVTFTKTWSGWCSGMIAKHKAHVSKSGQSVHLYRSPTILESHRLQRASCRIGEGRLSTGR